MAKKKYAFGGQAEAGMARRPTTAPAGKPADRPAGKPADRPTVKSPAMRAAPQALQNAAAQSRLMRPTAMATGGVPPTAANAAGASRGLDRAAAMSGRTMPARPVKPYAKGGAVRGDGCATKGKTKGRMV